MIIKSQAYILANISVDEKTGCWIWQKSLGSHGYGQCFVDGKVSVAHRLSYTVFKGDIPEGLHIDHLCFNRPCVNPEHLEAVPQVENNRRARSNGVRDRAKENAAKTHCPQGHIYSSENTYIYKGSRICRACHKTHARNYARKNRYADKDVV